MEIEIDYWERLKEVMTEDGLFVGVPFLLHLIAFWGLSLFFRHVDLYHTPISIYKKKFQPKVQFFIKFNFLLQFIILLLF